MSGWERLGRAGLALATGLLWVGASPAARAARIEVDPALKLVTCTTAACDTVAVQVALSLGENDADGFQFELDVTNASLVGWTAGQSVGGGAAGMTGGVVLQNDGVTLIGSFISNPASFDGPQTFDVALLDLTRAGQGTTELRFLSQEISCSTCNGGSGQIFGSGNTPGELLGVIVTPEPASAGLLALGLLALGSRARRRVAR